MPKSSASVELLTAIEQALAGNTCINAAAHQGRALGVFLPGREAWLGEAHLSPCWPDSVAHGSGRVVLFALPVAWLVGSAAGLLLAPRITLSVAETIVTIALGALLAADCPFQIAAVGALAILLGLLQGSLNGSELPKTTSSGQISATGVAVALFVVVSRRPDRPSRCVSPGRA